MTTAMEESDLSELSSQEASYDSENEVHDLQHAALIDAVSQLDSKQRIKPSTRKEPSLHVSEFHLTKKRDEGNGVQVNELAKSLKKRSSHAEIEKKLHSFQKKSSTLPKPLEKIHSEKIRREIGFENVKREFSKWDSVVHKNRAEPTLIFPLHQPSSRVEPMNKFVSKLKALKPGTLEAEIETFLAQAPDISKREESDEEGNVSLTLEEMTERRKEMARLRARQSYKEAKAARHSKIKSKKFHRIERKAKLKEQLKNFEALQKSDPEAALKQLEEIEKARVEERMSLRHRTTGKWAKSKAIRAKYDPDSRKVLAEQLALSRQLTEKVGKESSSDEEVAETEEIQPLGSVEDSDNPWLHETDPEINKFVAGYRKYWEERNKKEKKTAVSKNHNNRDTTNKKISSSINPDIVIENNDSIQRTDQGDLNSNIYKKKIIDNVNVNKIAKAKNKKENGKENYLKKNVNPNLTNIEHHNESKNKDNNNLENSIVSSSNASNCYFNSNNRSSLDLSVMSTSDSWTVREIPQKSDTSKKHKKLLQGHVSKNVKNKHMTNNAENLLNGDSDKINIDELFGRMGQQIKDKVNKKVDGLMSQLNSNDNVSDSDTTASADDQDKITFLQRERKKRPVIDKQLDEVPYNSSQVTENYNIEKLIKAAEIKRDKNRKKEKSANNMIVRDIDPNNYLKVKPKPLSSGLPDLITAGDEVLDDDDDAGAVELQKTIAEAFADDDVIAEFREEKKDAVDKSRPQDIDITLPGWGEWVGPNMKVSNRKKKRFILKFPEEAPRRDDNKGNVIINEEKNIKIKEHQVNTLPFPFESVKDFEASIRCPLGNTWVPETAHRKLIRPDVITRLGAVIEPMNEDVLVKNKKFKN